MLGHYVLDKNKSADNYRVAMELTMRYLEETFGHDWSPEMDSAMSKFLLGMVVDGARAKVAYLDSIYRH